MEALARLHAEPESIVCPFGLIPEILLHERWSAVRLDPSIAGQGEVAIVIGINGFAEFSALLSALEKASCDEVTATGSRAAAKLYGNILSVLHIEVE